MGSCMVLVMLVTSRARFLSFLIFRPFLCSWSSDCQTVNLWRNCHQIIRNQRSRSEKSLWFRADIHFGLPFDPSGHTNSDSHRTSANHENNNKLSMSVSQLGKTISQVGKLRNCHANLWSCDQHDHILVVSAGMAAVGVGVGRSVERQSQVDVRSESQALLATGSLVF